MTETLLNVNELLERYVIKRPHTDINDTELILDIVSAELDAIEDEYRTLENYARENEPNTVLKIYSIKEAMFLVDRLTPSEE